MLPKAGASVFVETAEGLIFKWLTLVLKPAPKDGKK